MGSWSLMGRKVQMVCWGHKEIWHRMVRKEMKRQMVHMGSWAWMGHRGYHSRRVFLEHHSQMVWTIRSRMVWSRSQMVWKIRSQMICWEHRRGILVHHKEKICTEQRQQQQ